MSSRFAPDSPEGIALVSWWKSLDEDRGGRAQLRRARTETEVIMSPTFHRLLHRLRPHLYEEEQHDPRLATIAGIASHIKINQPGRIARQLAVGSSGQPVASELRFRRLLQRDRDGLFTAMIRMVHLLHHSASLCDMAASVYYWGEKTQRDWAYLYYPLVPQKNKK